jgi:ribosomal protein S12 methylthiotransferase
MQEAQLDRVGCFKYSPVDGAKANALAEAVPEEVKEERYARFMECAARISRERLAARVGQRCRVLVDRVEGGIAIARSSGDAPEIDGVVHVSGKRTLRSGEFAEVLVTGSDDYDLHARSV